MKKTIETIETFVKATCGDRPVSHNHLHMFKVRDNADKIIFELTMMYYVLMFGISTFCYMMGVFSASDALIFDWSMLLLAMCIDKHVDALILIVDTTALLHDVADHKYTQLDSSLQSKLRNFLNELTSDQNNRSQVEGTVFKHLYNTKTILDIIERISFSRQQKEGKTDWHEVLGIWGILVRNIVSDADKLEAIGKTGIERCRDYIIEIYERNYPNHSDSNPNKDNFVKDGIIEHYHEKLKILASYRYMRTVPGWIWGQYLNRQMEVCIDEL